MKIFEKIFGRKKLNKFPTLTEFPKLNSDDRIMTIMMMGDSEKIEYFPFLKYAIEKDTDINVKFSALKRIHHFKNHSETLPLLNELKDNNIGQNYEPYLSMALLKLGIISEEEFSDKINNQT
jgi:hypothetical protein